MTSSRWCRGRGVGSTPAPIWLLAEHITRAILPQVAEMKKRLIRIPPAMDAELVRRAEEQDISISELIRVLLAGGLRFKLPEK